MFLFRRNSFWAAVCGRWPRNLPLLAMVSIESFLYPTADQLQWVHYRRPASLIGDAVLPYDRGSFWADLLRTHGFQTPVRSSVDQMRLCAHQMTQDSMMTLLSRELDAAKARRVSQLQRPGASGVTSVYRIGTAAQSSGFTVDNEDNCGPLLRSPLLLHLMNIWSLDLIAQEAQGEHDCARAKRLRDVVVLDLSALFASYLLQRRSTLLMLIIRKSSWSRYLLWMHCHNGVVTASICKSVLFLKWIAWLPICIAPSMRGFA